MTAMPALVMDRADIEITVIQDLESVRSPKKIEIDTERDLETVPGTKDNDYTAVDAVVTVAKAAVDAFSWTAI